jgi:two-component system response regulator RegX3
MRARILIIEDEPKIAELIALYLKKEGIETVHAASGEEGLEQLDQSVPDLVILDINLPGMDGFEVLQEIRRRESLPVVIVSARQEDEDMIMGFGVGADDYVSKPFSPKVLAARVRAHLKRQQRIDSSDVRQVSFGPYLLDMDNLWLKKNGERLVLPPKEMSLLMVLAEAPGKPFKQEELYERVWNNNYGDLTTVSVHIQRLRKRLEEDPATPRYLKTSYGSGYYLSEEG